MNESREKTIGKKRQKYPEYFKTRVFRTVTFQKPEDEELQKNAQYLGVKPTTFVRVATVAFMKGIKPLPKQVERDIAKLKYFWFNTGNSLNQIAKRVNILKKATIFDLMEAKTKLNKLITQFEESIRTLQANDFQDVHPQDGQF